MNDRAVRATVGPAALMTVKEARQASLALQNGEGLSGTGDGTDSSDVPLFREFATGAWKAAGARWTATRRKYVERRLETQLLPAFGSLRLDRIRRRDIERWFDAYSMSAPGLANEALQVLRQILNAAVDTGVISANPT